MEQAKHEQEQSSGGQQAGPDPEVIPGPRNRKFSREYKLRILAEAEQCERGEITELLKREGLYWSTLSKWRQQQAAGRLEEPVARQRKEDAQAEEIARLKREKARLEAKLTRAEAIIEVQKKLSELMGLDSD